MVYLSGYLLNGGKVYSIKESVGILGVSKVTVYKHMEKNGIEKGRKLSEEDINVLRKSISKNKVNTYTSKVVDFTKGEKYILMEKENKDLLRNIEKLEKEKKQLEEKLVLIEKDNRELISQMHNSQIMSNELIAQNIELVRETRLLLAPKEDKVEQGEAVVEKDVVEEVKVDQEVKKKKWWQR